MPGRQGCGALTKPQFSGFLKEVDGMYALAPTLPRCQGLHDMTNLDKDLKLVDKAFLVGGRGRGCES